MSRKFSDEERAIYEDLAPTSWGLVGAAIAGLLVIALRFFSHGNAVFSSFMWALAWFAAGFLFGFLFGIPKVLEQSRGGTKDGERLYQLGVNTNLEEISDWLTKILVGATLTQLIKVPGAIKSAATYMASGLGSSNLESFAASLLLFFSAIGFFSGYVLTRMFFQRAFSRSDASTGILSVALISTLKKTSIAIGAETEYSEEASKAAERASSTPITEKLSGDAAAALATSAIILGDANLALQASSLAIAKNPKDARSRLNYAVALHEAKADPVNIMEELERARDLITPNLDPVTREDIISSVMYLSLYLPQPAGFSTAINSGENYLRSYSPAHRSFWINIACAYAQKFAYLQTRQQTVDLKSTRERALDAAQRAILADPSSVDRLRELMLGTANPEDNDLKVFEADEDFRRLLGES